jgi:hypothetical protein
MSDDKTTVPKPDEARRDEDAIHYHQVDETDVGASQESGAPPADDKRRPATGE